MNISVADSSISEDFRSASGGSSMTDFSDSGVIRDMEVKNSTKSVIVDGQSKGIWVMRLALDAPSHDCGGPSRQASKNGHI